MNKKNNFWHLQVRQLGQENSTQDGRQNVHVLDRIKCVNYFNQNVF